MRFLLPLLLLSLLASHSLHAGTAGSLTGVVVDSTGAPIAGAVIIVDSVRKQGGISRPTTGRFTIAGLRPGRFTISIGARGYSSVTRVVTIVADSLVDAGIISLRVDARRNPGTRYGTIVSRGSARLTDSSARNNVTSLVTGGPLLAGDTGISIRGAWRHAPVSCAYPSRSACPIKPAYSIRVSEPFGACFGGSGHYISIDLLRLLEASPFDFSAEYRYPLSSSTISAASARGGRDLGHVPLFPTTSHNK